jgi:hypothetical protein
VHSLTEFLSFAWSLKQAAWLVFFEESPRSDVGLIDAVTPPPSRANTKILMKKNEL